MQELISALFDRWAGKPILVIGGGPSVNDDLPRLDIVPACVISANDHGSRQKRFPVDLYVNVDKIHCMKHIPMEKILRPLGAPIVNRHSWADYRLADWTFSGNTGQVAIVVACALGGNPVIVTGLDLWTSGRRYFHHDGDEKPRRMRRRIPTPAMVNRHRKLRPLLEATKGANVRPMSGPLCEVYSKYDPVEVLPSAKSTAYRRQLEGLKPIMVQTANKMVFSNLDVCPPGRILALSPREAKGRIETGRIRRI